MTTPIMSEAGYYIKNNTNNKKCILNSENLILLINSNIIELILPKCKIVSCKANYLKHLLIPSDCQSLDCSYNLLTELIIPKGCLYVDCSENKLTKLIIPKSCKWIHCANNNLPQLIIDLFQSGDPVKITLANNLQLTNNLQRN